MVTNTILPPVAYHKRQLEKEHNGEALIDQSLRFRHLSNEAAMIPPSASVLIYASRPAGWIFGPILFGMGFLQSGYNPKTISTMLLIISQILSFSFPLCIIVFGINDVYDYQSDVNNPRKITSGLEGGVLSPGYHDSVRRASYFSTVLILLVSSLTRRYKNVLATSLLLCFGWQYSAPPLRLKEVPFLDSLSNGSIIFLAWWVGYSYREGKSEITRSKSLILALCSSGIHALAAVVDYQWDMDAGQTTIATYWGQKAACVFAFLTFILAWYFEREGNGILKRYLQLGSVVLATSCLCPQWVHNLFQVLICWTLLMVFLWFASKIRALRALHNHSTCTT